jgi:hypothetical protein
MRHCLLLGTARRVGRTQEGWRRQRAKVIRSYEEFLDWAARIRGATKPSEYRNLLELLAQYFDGPIEQYREFVDNFVKQVDEIPASIAAKRELKIELHLAISIAESAKSAYDVEFGRMKERLKRDLDRS